MQVNGIIPYVSSSTMNNGVDGFIGNKENIRKFKNCLSLANSGSVGSCFYESFTFIASDHITHLKNKKYGKHIYLYIGTILNRLSEKYNFNREINDERIKREKIVLPTINNKIDFDYMDNFIRDKELKKYQEYINF